MQAGLPVLSNLLRSLQCRPGQARLPTVTVAFSCRSDAQDGPGFPRECVCHGPWPQGALTVDMAGG